MKHLCAKLIAGAALAYAFYNVLKCPCDKLVACHSKPYYISLGVAAFVIPVNNLLLKQ